MISMLGSALAGLARGETTASTTAADVSRISAPEPGDPDIATDFVTLSVAGAQVAVSSKVAEAAEEEQKTLLSIVA
jgi:hypothetical protein